MSVAYEPRHCLKEEQDADDLDGVTQLDEDRSPRLSERSSNAVGCGVDFVERSSRSSPTVPLADWCDESRE